MDDKNYTDDNMIVELDNASEDSLFDESPIEQTVIKEDELKITKKKRKEKKEFIWRRLSKKGKIITILIMSMIVLLISGLLLYFCVLKKDKPEVEAENIVIEKDNYIYDNGSLKFLDNKNKEIGIYKCTDQDAEKCYIAKLANEDNFNTPKYIDKDGKLIEKTSKIYNGRYVFIFDDNKIFLYDISKEEKEGNYELIKSGESNKDLIVAKEKDGNYGLFTFSDNNYHLKLDFKYDYLGIAQSDDIFVAKDAKSSYLIDINGKSVSSKINGDIKNFNNNYISVYNGNYLLYDYAGKKVLQDEFDYIDFVDDYIFTIKNTKMFAYDKTLFKLNEAGIKIKSSNYQKEYVFDENNNLSETKKAYNITTSSNTITVEIIESKNKSTTKEINLLEVVLSKKLGYISYLDGILYVYRDQTKKDLIGSYTCNNKNVIKSGSESFDNCFIAKDTNIVNKVSDLGYTPIFNDNYVFINDTKEGATNKTIILYDLKTGSQKAKYQEVDTGISSNEITFINSSNGLIYAKNTSGNLGVITFGTNGPEGLIAFQEDGVGTSKIEFLDDYLLVTRNNKQYLYTKVGKLLATSNFAIKEFINNYLVVKDKGYLVYNMASSTSGTIISDELDYIKLYQNLFVGIRDNKLNVYSLDDGKTPLINEDLEIKTTTLESAYKFTIDNNSYIIEILQKDGTFVEYKYNLDWSILE